MGNYNPHTPYILGQEWTPIREEDLQYSPSVNAVEIGTSYVQSAVQRIRDGRFYIHEMQAPIERTQCAMLNLYPYGSEDLTGPLSQVIIPVNGIVTTGTGITNATVSALYQSGDNDSVKFAYNGVLLQEARIWFNVNAYPILNGKRILNVSLLYSGAVTDLDPVLVGGTTFEIPFVNPTPNTLFTIVKQRDEAGDGQEFTGPEYAGNVGALASLAVTPPGHVGSVQVNQVIGVLNMGDVNNFWDSTAPPVKGAGNPVRMPWRYADLQKLDFNYGAATRQHLYLAVQIPTTPYAAANPANGTPFLNLDYLALRVVYCEETRIAYGGRLLDPYRFGTNILALRDSGFNTDPVIAAGRYIPTLSWVNPGEIDYNNSVDGAFPKVNGLRELYQLPSHLSRKIDVPFPVEDRLGDTFDSQFTSIMPQLSLHTSGGPLTEPHVYGRQAIGQVYGSNTVTQDIQDGVVGGATTFPQVRYYARRFGDTTVNLLLDSPTITGAGTSVTLTPAEWDALPETFDGWKEITKRFVTPPSMGSGINPIWRWSASGEVAGNRWEILGAAAPAISGVPGSFTTLVPAAQRVGAATYGQPTAGASINMAWLPGIAPLVTATTDDEMSDAVLIFSQDPPTITGVTITPSSQALTGFVECAKGPCCAPTALSYTRITWSPTTLPTTGFGAYQLQRWDDITAEWQNIMVATHTTVTGFNDYESRVGVTSKYQIRQTNVLNFSGSWSVTGSATITEPGVTMPACGTNKRGILIFTTNEVQDGSSNLAYAMTWDSDPTENFSFPEAGTVDIETYHDRDFQVAFHGTERGGETFSRRLLLANAAVALPRLANAKSLRDLAWRDLAYVCVRDGIGDRWFSTVIVPNDAVKRNRRLYNANVTVVEVTDQASEVDP